MHDMMKLYMIRGQESLRYIARESKGEEKEVIYIEYKNMCLLKCEYKSTIFDISRNLCR